jgi:CDP-paratose 2-epimerase
MKNLRDSNILITGGLGFIGFNLVLELLGNVKSIIIFDNLSSKSSKKNFYLFKKLMSQKNIIFYKENILNIGKFKTKISPDIIIHLAADLNQLKGEKNLERIIRNNTIGTLKVLNLASYLKIPIIFASTCKVYSNWINEMPIIEKETRYIWKNKILGISEKLPIEKKQSSRGAYGLSKYLAEEICKEYFCKYRIPIIINRLSGIYGKYQWGTKSYGWVWHFTELVKKNKPVNIYGTGKQVRDILFIDDLVNLFKKQILALLNNKFNFEIYNIGGGSQNTVSVLEMINTLSKISGKQIKIKFLPERYADLKIYISDIQKASRDFNWRPKINFTRGIKVVYYNNSVL